MSIRYFDSHAHLTCDAVYQDIEGVLQRAQACGVEKILNICTDRITLERGLELAKKYTWISNAAATTPHDVDKEGEELFPLMEKHAREGNLVAVGESGLDYHYHHSNVATQKFFLKKYLNLALETQLPIIIHCRDAFDDLFEILRSDYRLGNGYGPGILHCFTGTVKEAEKVIEMGWFLSLSGIITFKKSEELRKVAQMVPLENLLIETDSPYLAPQSKRGKQNEPAYIAETAELIAQVKNVTFEETARITFQNGCKLF